MMRPAVLCLLGIVCLLSGMAARNLWTWSPLVGWALALIFIFGAIFTAVKNNKSTRK
ncbi:hypothetical protein P9314_15230 [Paenibacillus validus]|uniref:Uncharacterized protein n=1 Tax=Paenibacillus validus TaxID=44253 RepID=A0A7X2ZDH2_9BACL|nr:MULTISPECIES: hypothetical protein [Paenibacillus]MED4602048.1 hypothetical protein [Paenibacillus validus]MED4607588.1 hypothetical protein [Paenibacillus validus]MUG72218.1 hypothetical protein [Paenibacillus validus]